MQKYLPVLLAALLVIALISGCNGDEAQADTSNDESQSESAPIETEAEESHSDTSAAPVSYTINDLTVTIPGSYMAQDVSQSADGLLVHMLYLQNAEHIAAISSTSYDTGSGFIVDDDESLDACIEGMCGILMGQGGKPDIRSQTDTAYVQHAGQIWAHRNVVIKAGGEYGEFDIFVSNQPDIQHAAIFLTADTDKKISGTNSDMVKTVMGSMSIRPLETQAEQEAPEDGEAAQGETPEESGADDIIM